MSDKPTRNTITLGDMLISTDRKTGQYETDANGNPKKFHIQVYLPEDVDSVELKSGDYINFRVLEDEDFEKMPEKVRSWKEPLAQLRAWVKNKEQ